MRRCTQDKGSMIAGDEVFKGIQNQGEHTAVWTIPADLPYFEGHFPGNPIFPAVGIVDATLYFLRTELKVPKIYVSHFPVAKFLSPIQPGQTVRIELKNLSGKEWTADWKDSEAGKLLATLRFHL